MTVKGTDINLWWPNGLGNPNLYKLTFTFTTEAGETLKSTRRIGFRVFALVTGNDTDPEYVKESQTESGTDGAHGMLYRVNGAAIWARGANVIPMEE
jgi:beta-galactosidase/beta-glucuronidase